MDQYFGSNYLKDPNALMSAGSELKDTKDRLREWVKEFPVMRVCISNHGLRWAKKAFDAGIPNDLVRPYQEILGIPVTWQYKLKWEIDTKHKFICQHGMGYSGQLGHRNACLDNGVSTVIGHLHSFAGIVRVKTESQNIWGMNVGCLIDEEAFAFNYAKYSRNKAVLGCGVILDDGKNPQFISF